MTDLLETRFERQPAMVTRRVAGELILVPDTRRMDREAALYVLDDVAAFLWERLDGQHTGHDLIRALVASYSVSPQEAEKDVRTFLAQLEEIEALRPGAGATRAVTE